MSIASWADTVTNVELLIDWNKIGLSPDRATVQAPAVRNFQDAHSFEIVNGSVKNIAVPKNKGLLLVVKGL